MTKALTKPKRTSAAPAKPADSRDVQLLKEHIHSTYLFHIKSKYPFNGMAINAIKRLLGLYTRYELMALWDIFIKGKWDFDKNGEHVKVPHDLRWFQIKLTVLLENPEYKAAAKKYAEADVPSADMSDLSGIFKSVPPKEDSQKNKFIASKLYGGGM